MPKAGKFDFPFFDVDSTVNKLKKFHEVIGSDETTREIIADTLGMSITGGGFGDLIASMKKYGLVQIGGGKVIVTDRGKLAIYGEPREVEQAKSQAVKNIELFREIAKQYGKSPQTDQIKIFLRQKANVDIVKAKKIAPKVAKIYKKVAKYITSAEKLAPPTKEPMLKAPSFGRRDMIVQPEPSVVELLKIQFGDVYIQIPSDAKSLDSIRLAKDALDFMEQRLLKEQKEKKTN